MFNLSIIIDSEDYYRERYLVAAYARFLRIT